MIFIFGFIIGLVFVGFLILVVKSPGKLPPCKDAQGNVKPDSISEKAWITVGGMRQGMFIRGENKQNPVILYLHGGPGTPLLQFISYLEKEERLEQYATVCYWEQRGAGMTYGKSTPPNTMTIEQLVEDTREVTEYLKLRFGQDKIYLIGHSWGSYLGVKTIEKYPENYLAYIGIGQVTNQTESERLAYHYMQKCAKERNDKYVIQKLEQYNPHADTFPQLDYLVACRTRILNKYGIGNLHQGVSFLQILKALFVFKGYTIREKMNWLHGAGFSMKYLFPIVLKNNLFTSSVKFAVPFYIAQGNYDYMVSQSLAQKYFNVIEAPQKEFFAFRNSAHSPNMEEQKAFIEIFRKIALENPHSHPEKEEPIKTAAHGGGASGY